MQKAFQQWKAFFMGSGMEVKRRFEGLLTS
jgi:hypothetical protein